MAHSVLDQTMQLPSGSLVFLVTDVLFAVRSPLELPTMGLRVLALSC